MDDALFVCRLERIGDLPCDRQRLGERDRSTRDDRRQVVPVDELHHQGVRLAAVDLRDVRVVQRRERLRLAREPGEPLGILREEIREDLDRDVAIELCVPGAVDLTHAACPESSDDLVRAESGAGGEHCLEARSLP